MSVDMIARKLKTERIKRKISQKQLSMMTGISNSVISNIECGYRNVRLQHIQAIGDALGINPSSFIESNYQLQDRFGDNLELIRNATGMTQLQLSEFLGISATRISLYESGNRAEAKVITHISKKLDLSPDELQYSNSIDFASIALNLTMKAYNYSSKNTEDVNLMMKSLRLALDIIRLEK